MGGAYEGDNFQNILFENPIGNTNNWINIVLEGSKSNRSAIGAKIVATIQETGASRKIFHTVGTGASFGGNSLMAEIGLGKAITIDTLEVIWPNKERSVSLFTNVKTNTTIRIKENSNEIVDANLNPVAFKKMEGHQH